MSSIQYAPPASALELSDPTPATQFYWFRFPRDWHDAAHPTPRRQLFIVLDGEVEGWTSKGDTRILRAGDRLLMEDTTGKRAMVRALSTIRLLQLSLPWSSILAAMASLIFYRIWMQFAANGRKSRITESLLSGGWSVCS